MVNGLLAQVSGMNLSNIQLQFVPASDVTASEAALHGVPIVPFSKVDSIDIFVDEANEISVSDNRIAYLVGRGENGPQAGQPNIPRLQKALSISTERIVLSSSRDVGSCRLLTCNCFFIVCKDHFFSAGAPPWR